SAASPTWPSASRLKARSYSSSGSLCLISLIADHGNEQVGDAWRAHVAERSELLPIDPIEQQDAAAEHLALMNGLQCARFGDMLGVHHHLAVAGLELLHAALEHDATAVDEQDIGEGILGRIEPMAA